MKMWTQSNLYDQVLNQAADGLFHDMYDMDNADHLALKRICDVLNQADFVPTYLFSAPGRTELGGNHTDHNLGKVLCAAVGKDTLAAVSPRQDGHVVIRSAGFEGVFEVDCADLTKREDETGTTQALIRGVMAGIAEAGGKLGGFNAQVTSSVGVGSGLSSSASFEVLIGTIINNLYNNNSFSPERIARIGQFSENEYFGKPCGLMDQTASAVGGILEIDFKDPEHIDIQKVGFDLTATEYVLLVLNTGGNHADLTPAYASIPEEMKLVAQEFGCLTLREVDYGQFIAESSAIRAKLGDRAVLRAHHFYSENQRVDSMVRHLKNNAFDAYLNVVKNSGLSSQTILQNAIPPSSKGSDQGLALALGLSRLYFERTGRGIARVHGGGFAGTIQAYVHQDDFHDYEIQMNKMFGQGSLEKLRIRNAGACEILRLDG